AGELLPRGALSQLIAAVIVFVRGVAFGPDPYRLVLGDQPVQLLPEVAIHYRLSGRRNPVLSFPAVNPGRDAVFHILGVGYDFHLARLFERAQAFDNRGQFHSIIRSMRLGAVHLAFVTVKAEDACPSAWTGVAEA